MLANAGASAAGMWSGMLALAAVTTTTTETAHAFVARSSVSLGPRTQHFSSGAVLQISPASRGLGGD